MNTPGMPEQPAAPSLPWRFGSSAVMGTIGMLSRSFLCALNRFEVVGLERFQQLLDERKNVAARTRGLITVSNHLSVVDDPMMWGALPFRYHWNPNSMRWALGSHDIVFKNKTFSTFFAFGQVFPTHRSMHSPHGGLFQPTITQAIRLLSSRDSQLSNESANIPHRDITDPFSSAHLTYTTDGADSYPVPSIYATRKHAWVHIYPEGRIHQKADKTMRYFKWGVARLILESEPCPDVVPMWIEGFDRIMHESRTFPRFIPRGGKDVSVTFGEKVDMEARFGDLRERWRQLVLAGEKQDGLTELGECPESLKYSDEAVKLREECTIRVREEVLKLRRDRAWTDEDPKARLADTWRIEGKTGKREGQMADGSWSHEEGVKRPKRPRP